jgi:hypothetical protein
VLWHRRGRTERHRKVGQVAAPADGRQMTKAPATLSVGQCCRARRSFREIARAGGRPGTAVLFRSVGQTACCRQFSATSQSPAAARQTVELGAKASAGQAAPEPVQCSAASHTPVDALHTVELGWNASVGQAALDPVQCSATSQSPADARQTVALDWKVSPGQTGPEPVHVSATSHAPADGRQTVAPDANPSTGQLSWTPSQTSCTSHAPAAGRHTNAPLVLPRNTSGGQFTPRAVAVLRLVAPAEPRQRVVFGATASAGQAGPGSGAVPATSHAGRSKVIVALDRKPSAGQRWCRRRSPRRRRSWPTRDRRSR